MLSNVMPGSISSPNWLLKSRTLSEMLTYLGNQWKLSELMLMGFQWNNVAKDAKQKLNQDADQLGSNQILEQAHGTHDPAICPCQDSHF